MSENVFGVLTLATKEDYLKAIGLALTLRISNPGLNIAVACEYEVKNYLIPYFDYVVTQDKSVKGFEHKLNIDKYTPFKKTLFLDSDIFVFRRLNDFIENWPKVPYTACGRYVYEGYSAFGFDRKLFIEKNNFEKMVCVDGSGHGYFILPDAIPFFDRARSIAKNYKEHAGDIRLADEDVVNMVMTEFGYDPAEYDDFFSRFLSAKKGTLKMDIIKAKCGFFRKDNDVFQEPCIMHFAADEAPVYYSFQLYKLFRFKEVRCKGLWVVMLGDIYKLYLRGKLSSLKRKFRSLFP